MFSLPFFLTLELILEAPAGKSEGAYQSHLAHVHQKQEKEALLGGACSRQALCFPLRIP